MNDNKEFLIKYDEAELDGKKGYELYDRDSNYLKRLVGIVCKKDDGNAEFLFQDKVVDEYGKERDVKMNGMNEVFEILTMKLEGAGMLSITID